MQFDPSDHRLCYSGRRTCHQRDRLGGHRPLATDGCSTHSGAISPATADLHWPALARSPASSNSACRPAGALSARPNMQASVGAATLSSASTTRSFDFVGTHAYWMPGTPVSSTPRISASRSFGVLFARHGVVVQAAANNLGMIGDARAHARRAHRHEQIALGRDDVRSVPPGRLPVIIPAMTAAATRTFGILQVQYAHCARVGGLATGDNRRRIGGTDRRVEQEQSGIRRSVG